ncbi:cellulose synthase complex periplasmic endoglucanase BcsZ [Stenotrophomonas sp. C3(2023)]|uniref:cellulose synthase complex periplasmic endoglucanase BcsZ n=1 Tax=Stenotrophomonas sp. C3(2023) TaxID=3080277 RepID=UPI00293CDBD8|nr:cellulose synthase complex periplasmic endoglucanase BcsZ [Stenotrophomonas sp. C3(2023)]MDV3469625.1 cellulose synthase complex periplasmic endoglucanase BcsZ [Stenotrophomonas sp. C3(2023)]
MSSPNDSAPGTRRAFLRILAAAAATAALPLPLQAVPLPRPCPDSWREWSSFVQRNIDESGRVIDFFNTDLRSTSESQSYGLFFALVANDQVLFGRILAWTRQNLSAGRADINLPAWLWGKAADGSWRVLDPNTASDGELWIAYALLEAGRLWNRPGFTAAGKDILALMRKAEIVDLPGFGTMLLPGVQGFVKEERWTLNPSYLPLFVLRRFAMVDAKGPWRRLIERSVVLMEQSAPNGFAPDWVAWNGRAFVADPDKGSTGSYDAIRCYLWAGMIHPADPLRARMLQALSGPLSMLRAQGRLAEKVDVKQGVGTGTAPVGFSAALLPYLSAAGEPTLLRNELARIPADADLNYYDRVLILYGKGWHDGRYRFSADGRLQPAWSTACSANA